MSRMPQASWHSPSTPRAKSTTSRSTFKVTSALSFLSGWQQNNCRARMRSALRRQTRVQNGPGK
eukprot:3718594-Pleurochrysis_carterae.AAC.1